MAEAQRGDVEAYGELLNEIGPMVMSFVRARIREADDVEDLYQDIFMAVHRARHSYDAARPLEPWLFGIARHVVADHAERRRARRAREVVVAATPDRAVESDAHVKPQLEQALRRMSGEQRQAIALLRIDGLPVDAAARRAGTTPGALRVRAHRAYGVLRRLLGFYDDSGHSADSRRAGCPPQGGAPPGATSLVAGDAPRVVARRRRGRARRRRRNRAQR